MNITNKTVLITGGGSGIGYETTKLLSEKNNKVIIIGRTLSKLNTAAGQLQNVTAIPCNVNDAEQVAMLVERVTRDFPELSVLINNAGRGFTYTHGQDASAFEKAKEEFATNYFSILRITEAFLPLLKSSDEAAIVNVTSIGAITPAASLPSYCDSKAAVHSYTLSLRHTLAKDTGIKVFELMPSLVNTEFSKEVGGEKGISPIEVAQVLLAGMEHDIFEIYAGDTAEFRRFFLSSPNEAFAMMNQG